MRIASLHCTSKNLFFYFLNVFNFFNVSDFCQFCPNFSFFFFQKWMFGRSIFTLLEEGSHNFPSISSLVDFYSLNLTKPLPCHLTENPILMWFFFLLSIVHYDILFPSYKEKNGIIFTKYISSCFFLNINFLSVSSIL